MVSNNNYIKYICKIVYSNLCINVLIQTKVRRNVMYLILELLLMYHSIIYFSLIIYVDICYA